MLRQEAFLIWGLGAVGCRAGGLVSPLLWQGCQWGKVFELHGNSPWGARRWGKRSPTPPRGPSANCSLPSPSSESQSSPFGLIYSFCQVFVHLDASSGPAGGCVRGVPSQAPFPRGLNFSPVRECSCAWGGGLARPGLGAPSGWPGSLWRPGPWLLAKQTGVKSSSPGGFSQPQFPPVRPVEDRRKVNECLARCRGRGEPLLSFLVATDLTPPPDGSPGRVGVR